MEEYEIRRTTVTANLNGSVNNSFRTPVIARSQVLVTPMSNSTMIEEKRVVLPVAPPVPEQTALYTTAPDNNSVFTEVDGKTIEKRTPVSCQFVILIVESKVIGHCNINTSTNLLLKTIMN